MVTWCNWMVLSRVVWVTQHSEWFSHMLSRIRAIYCRHASPFGGIGSWIWSLLRLLTFSFSTAIILLELLRLLATICPFLLFYSIKALLNSCSPSTVFWGTMFIRTIKLWTHWCWWWIGILIAKYSLMLLFVINLGFIL